MLPKSTYAPRCPTSVRSEPIGSLIFTSPIFRPSRVSTVRSGRVSESPARRLARNGRLPAACFTVGRGWGWEWEVGGGGGLDWYNAFSAGALN